MHENVMKIKFHFWIPTGHILQIRFKHDGGKLIEKEIAGYRSNIVTTSLKLNEYIGKN
jgi:hypothetical protein